MIIDPGDAARRERDRIMASIPADDIYIKKNAIIEALRYLENAHTKRLSNANAPWVVELRDRGASQEFITSMRNLIIGSFEDYTTELLLIISNMIHATKTPKKEDPRNDVPGSQN